MRGVASGRLSGMSTNRNPDTPWVIAAIICILLLSFVAIIAAVNP